MDRQERTKCQPDASHTTRFPYLGTLGWGSARVPAGPAAGPGHQERAWGAHTGGCGCGCPAHHRSGSRGPPNPRAKPPAALEQAPTEQDSFPCAQVLGRGCEDEGPAARTPGERGAGRHISPQGKETELG